ncbi:Conserved hypothetical protein [Shewanella piezotolerans WP3]|uniref:TehB/YeaR-like domain-containing protein n=1 Tax=Shewanella piezotolerans (strain WP3 / JCM 13877) TaxID=225849 RepID=B8CJZ0_SHEPW|nr:Conserved hypothetical protein [Shewanella piezotolerans WP3]
MLSGTVKFYGFKDRRAEVETELLIEVGQTAISPPQYWHKVELLTADTQFRVDFWAQADSAIVAENQSERDD